MVDHEPFRDTCRSGFVSLCDVVAEKEGHTAVESCFRHLVNLPDFAAGSTTLSKLDFYLLPRCLHNPTNWSTLVRYLEAQRSRAGRHQIVALKLYGYVQCLEVRYTYKVVGNLLGRIGGGTVSGDLYDSASSARACFEDIKRRRDQVAIALGRRIALVDTWSRFIDFDLRNAVGHSDFVILGNDETVLLPYYALSSMTRSKMLPRKSTYTFSEVDDLYAMANDFIEAFRHVTESLYASLGPRY